MSYFEAKRAALRGEAYYDYITGIGYEEIPVSQISRGYHLDDQRNQDADSDPQRRKNLPQFRAALSVDTDDGLDHGYFRYSEERAALDLAPDFVKSRVPVWNQIGNCLAAERALWLPHHLNTGAEVCHLDIKPIYRGNALGLLFEPPFLEEAAQGKLNRVRLH